jgi:diguanylate cyclase (GGDEF)-like protein
MAEGGASVGQDGRLRRADDLLMTGITVATLLMVVLSCVMIARLVGPSIWGGAGASASAIFTVLLVNTALALFGWFRFRDLKREVGRRRIAEGQAYELATCDPLTGMLNRRALSEAAAKMLESTQRDAVSMAVLMIDLDHFKSVNDVHGHLAGDLLLRAAAEAIRGRLPANAIAARLGGDEFACAFPFDPGHPGLVESVAAAIITRLSQPFDVNGSHAVVGASMGIAHTDADCRSIDALMRRSDIALYAAKRAGRNRLMWFDESMERELSVRNGIERGLRIGVPKGEVVPYFEPQVNLGTGAIIGFEMLARWDHPDHGIVEPDLFIAIAEESGLIGELSMRAMRAAMEEAREWDASLHLAANISPAQMRDPWLAQKIVKLLMETRFPPERFEIEITEASLFENIGLAQSIIGSLKNQGVRVALDDFGTGYSSLTHLRALPLDRIKIDRRFVTAMDDDRESAAIVATINNLAGFLNIAVMAEGVETAAIRAGLQDMGCREGQGWLFGRPMPARQTRSLLAGLGLLAADSQASPTSSVVSGRQDRRRAG